MDDSNPNQFYQEIGLPKICQKGKIIKRNVIKLKQLNRLRFYFLFLDQKFMIYQFWSELFLKYQSQLLCYYIQLMNSFSVFKLVIPTLKTTNKLFQAQNQKSKEQFFRQFYGQLKSLTSEKTYQSFPTIDHQELIEPQLVFPKEESQSDINEEFELNKSTNSFMNTHFKLQKNMINHRIKSLQYQANNPCEDTVKYDQLKAINAFAISIFDGHGGPELATYSRAKINEFIDSFLKDRLTKPFTDIGELIKESLKWSYQKIQDTFFETYQQQIKFGNKRIRNVGTCGITAIVHNDKVYVGNAGDSQAIFILKEGLGMFRTEKACDRLSVNSKSQRDKLKARWAGIDNNIITEQANNVFYLKGRLQPTRTIGDYYLKKKEYYLGGDSFKGPYLSCVPEVGQHQITKSHKYMVIASDGIWDALSKHQLLNIMMSQKEIDLNKTFYDHEGDEQPPYIKNVVNKILQKASQMSGVSVQDLKNMEKGARRNYHDDITLAVINLGNQLQ